MTVLLANINGGDLTAPFVQSLASTLRAFTADELDVMLYTGLYVPEQRDTVVVKFFGTGRDWLLFVDSDMEWRPDDIRELLAAADPQERPVVGAVAFSPYREHVLPVGWVKDAPDAGSRRINLDRDSGVVRVDRTGAAFLLIHRSVLDRIRVEHKRTFAMGFSGLGVWIGEDFWFCDRCRELDIPVHIHTDVRVKHWKRVSVDERLARAVGRPDAP